MQDKKKLSPFMVIIIGMAASALLGLLASQYLLYAAYNPESLPAEDIYWRMVVIFCGLVYAYLYFVDTFKYKPFFFNMLILTGKTALLLMPFILIIIVRDAVAIPVVLAMLPAQLLFIVAFFIWLTATEIDPDLEKNGFKMYLINVVVGLICATISCAIIAIPSDIFSWDLMSEENKLIFLGLSLSLTLVFGIIYASFILWRAQRKASQRSSAKQDDCQT